MHLRDMPPELVRLAPSPVPTDNLPAELSSLVGRGREQEEVAVLLGTNRLVTLVGAGGVGKTRLALRVASNLRDAYADGVWLVELAPLVDGRLVAQAVARGLSIRERPGQALLPTLLDALAGCELLLVLDNCEHVVQASAELASALLQACPGLRILATSRERLAVAGEVAWRVPSLSVPATYDRVRPDDLAGFGSVDLFVERARAAAPTFGLTDQNAPLVAEVCRRLDGIPLALELSASRVGHLGLKTLAQRLDDQLKLLVGTTRAVPERQQTLRAALEWSFALLSPPERRLLLRLSVFVGTWALETAERVCADGRLPAEDVLGLLSRLVDQSLVQVEPAPDSQLRYRLLEPLRQYARAQLRAKQDEAELDVLRRYAVCYVELVEQAQPELRGSAQATWLQRLELEADNIRAALDWLTQRPEPDLALRLATAAAWYWIRRAHYLDARRLVVLLNAPLAFSPRVRAAALLAAARVASARGDYGEQAACDAEAVRLYRELHDAQGVAEATTDLGSARSQQGRLEEARAALEDGLVGFRGIGDEVGIATALLPLAMVARDQGDFERAELLFAEALALRRAQGDLLGVAHVQSNQAWLAYYQGRYREARQFGEESIAIRDALGARREAGITRTLLARAALAAGERERARELFLACLVVHRELGNPWGVVEVLEGMAEFHASARPERALRLAGVAAGLRASIGRPQAPVAQVRYERVLQQARRALGAAPAGAAFAAGGELSEAQAIAEVLAEEASAEAARPAAPERRVGGLTPREEEVVRLVGRGLSNRQIAERLVIAEGTARVHVEHVLAKLELRSRAQLAAWAVQQDLVDREA